VQPEPAPVPRPAAAPPPPPEPDPAPVAITSLRFHIDEETGKTIVSVVDPSTGQVVRQIPSEEALALARHLGDAHGVLVNLKA
jgi:flagellar protein FlaG